MYSIYVNALNDKEYSALPQIMRISLSFRSRFSDYYILFPSNFNITKIQLINTFECDEFVIVAYGVIGDEREYYVIPSNNVLND